MITEVRLDEINRVWQLAGKMGSIQVRGIDIKELYDEIIRLKKIIAQELTENDELGSEFTYVMALKEEAARLREGLRRVIQYEGQGRQIQANIAREFLEGK